MRGGEGGNRLKKFHNKGKFSSGSGQVRNTCLIFVLFLSFFISNAKMKFDRFLCGSFSSPKYLFVGTYVRATSFDYSSFQVVSGIVRISLSLSLSLSTRFKMTSTTTRTNVHYQFLFFALLLHFVCS